MSARSEVEVAFGSMLGDAALVTLLESKFEGISTASSLISHAASGRVGVLIGANRSIALSIGNAVRAAVRDPEEGLLGYQVQVSGNGAERVDALARRGMDMVIAAACGRVSEVDLRLAGMLDESDRIGTLQDLSMLVSVLAEIGRRLFDDSLFVAVDGVEGAQSVMDRMSGGDGRRGRP